MCASCAHTGTAHGHGTLTTCAHRRPFGEHGWIPIPLALLDLCLVLLSDFPSHLWRDDSWWASCHGPLWGQLPALAVCTFTILPALLAAWLLWMPWQCSPLPVALAAAVLLLAAASLLFWADRLPLLPRARASPGAARRGARRALLQLLHPLLFAAGTHFFWGHHGGRGHPACAALLDGLLRRPADFGAVLAEELQAQTPQGQHTPRQLALQLGVAALCVYALLDAARAPRRA